MSKSAIAQSLGGAWARKLVPHLDLPSPTFSAGYGSPFATHDRSQQALAICSRGLGCCERLSVNTGRAQWPQKGSQALEVPLAEPDPVGLGVARARSLRCAGLIGTAGAGVKEYEEENGEAGGPSERGAFIVLGSLL